MGTAPANAYRAINPAQIPPALESLPPFPAVALKALNVLAGTETSLRELCDVIRPDPVFSAEILRLANSPLVAFSKEVTSVLQASMLLGFRRLRRLVITVGLRSYLDSASARLLRPCWRHSVACGMIAERAARWNSVDCDFAYTGGILHDISRVVLATLSPELYAAMLEHIAAAPVEMLRHEREVFGMDHCQAGSRLILAWHLPDRFTAIVSHHHDPLARTEDAAEGIRLSCRLADALGFTGFAHDSLHDPSEVLGEFPEEVRTHFPKAADLASEIDHEISVIEAA